MKILVTGGSGFIGGSLIRSLIDSGIEPSNIVCPVRSQNSLIVHSANSIIINLLDVNQSWKCHLSSVNVVVHCAARVHMMREFSKNPLAEYRRVNVDGTLNLAQQAAEAGVKRFIFISSIKVNGDVSTLGKPFTPDDLTYPLDPYGISKMEAEEGLRELSVRTGMEVVIIRPPLVYGSGVGANFATMMQWLKRGVPLPLGGITLNMRSLVFVENLVDLIQICINHPKAANQTFLISDDEDVSTTTLLRKMAKALGCPARLVNIPPTLIKLSARFIGKPGIADRLCGSLQVDITKTKELLGWSPKFSLDEGLIWTAKPTVTTCDI